MSRLVHVSCRAMSLAFVYRDDLTTEASCYLDFPPGYKACDWEPAHEHLLVYEDIRAILKGWEPNSVTCPMCAVMLDQAMSEPR